MKHQSKALAGVVGLALLTFLLTAVSVAFCLERPTAEQIQQYKTDGTWNQRLTDARAFGNHRVDPVLVERMKYNTQRQILESQGMSPQQIDQVLAPPPAWRGMPTKGNVKVLILMIAFADMAPVATDTQPTMVSKIFGAGGSGSNYPYESMANYYKRASYSQLMLRGDVLGWYTTAYNRSSVIETTAGRQNLIKEALNYYDAQGVDFSQYDNDGDGDIDYFAVVWTGAHGPWASFWWGYQTNFNDSSYTLDGKRLGKYSWQWESYNYPNPAYSFDPLVLIHETGHALGLPDLYDYDPTVGPGGGVGGLDMMDANWGDHNCFSKYLMEWLTPSVVSGGSMSHALHSSGTSGDAMLIMPGTTGSTEFDEFFMIQSRFREANDTTYPSDGLLIWHIDSRLDASADDYLYDNSYTAHKLVRLMEADGLEQIERGVSVNAGDYYVAGKSLAYNTVPNSSRYNGAQSGVVINNIGTGTLLNTFSTSIIIAPTVSITQPTQYRTVNGTVVIQATAATDSGTITQVEFYVDGVSIGVDSSAPYEVSWNTYAAGIGAHILRADATNSAGVTNNSAPVTVFFGISQSKALIIDLGSDNASGTAIASALADNNVYSVTASSITSIDASAFPAVFVSLGYYPGNHIISSTESSYLVAFLNAGGSLYIEGADTWYYDPHQPIRDAMGIKGIADSGGTLSTINGRTGTITQNLSFVFEGTQGWVDNIDVAAGVTDAARIWQNSSPAYYVGVARNTGTYKAIGCAFEFGNIPAAQRNAVMAAYLGFMIVRPNTQSTPPPDIDGDGKTDIAVYRPSTGIWYARLSATPGSFKSIQWGESGDVPVPADYDGDGQSDLAVFRPITGFWYILFSSVRGDYTATVWGVNQDIPVPGDYDGDQKADIAVFRPTSGTWYVRLSGTAGSYVVRQWGVNGDIPVPGDYDADGKTDFAVWRPGSGIWFALPSSNPGNYTSTLWGMNGDVPTPGDFDADGKTDMTVYRPGTGTWYSLSSSTPGSYTSIPWGMGDDVPTPGDYDGDGKADIAIWRPSNATWYVRPSGSPASYSATQWGLADDLAVSPITGILFFIP